MGRLSGKRALVTGASSGIGREVARPLRARGRARRRAAAATPSGPQRTVAEIAADGRQRVRRGRRRRRRPRAPTPSWPQAAEALGGLDTLVSNAGIDATEWQDVADWDVAEFDRILATNLRGPFLVARAAIPHMLDAGGGAIVHMSSVCAITVWAGDCAYDVSKAGLNMLSDHIAVEYGAARHPLQHADARGDPRPSCTSR